MRDKIEVHNLDYKMVIKDFVSFLCKELQINPNKVYVYGMDESVYKEQRAVGACIDEPNDEFILLVYQGSRKIENIFDTIAHEMIHVKQFLKENLNHWLNTCSDVPYKQQWWEVEAWNNSANLVIKFANFLKGKS